MPPRGERRSPLHLLISGSPASGYPQAQATARRRASGGGGTTSATGLPKRVTRMGCLVLRTCSSRANHCALNLELAIVPMTALLDLNRCTMVK